jgi:hypothetical protein
MRRHTLFEYSHTVIVGGNIADFYEFAQKLLELGVATLGGVLCSPISFGLQGLLRSLNNSE